MHSVISTFVRGSNAHAVAFDPKEFNQIITETVQWERREKARMLAEAEALRPKFGQDRSFSSRFCRKIALES